MPLAPFLREITGPGNEARGLPGRLEALALPFTDARLETAYRYWQQKAGDRESRWRCRDTEGGDLVTFLLHEGSKDRPRIADGSGIDRRNPRCTAAAGPAPSGSNIP